MHPEHPILRRPLAPRLGDPPGSVAGDPAPAHPATPPPDALASRETWRRVLAAHVQPPHAAD